MSAVLELEEAQARLLALRSPLSPQSLPIGDAAGHYLAEPIVAQRTQPAADLSAMDGYAVRATDLGQPWRIIGESRAGQPYAGEVRAGEAVRIATGALVPAGADCVVVQEDCRRDGGALTLAGTGPAPPDRHIRRRGIDFAEGDALLPIGARLGPAQLALAISAGYGAIAVGAKPRVVIVETGDELLAPGAPCPPHGIPASNGAMLAAMLATLPCAVTTQGPLSDDATAIAEALSADADVIITSGGASVGDHDQLAPALTLAGAETVFGKVAIRPGRPLLVARRGEAVILGLPGNPAASFVAGMFFALPLVRHLAGASQPLPRALPARLGKGLPGGGARREFRRAHWDGARVHDGDRHDSGVLASLAASNCFIERAAYAAAATEGAIVEIWPFDTASGEAWG